MSTNSRIGIIRKDGTSKYIYCHWDGYICGNGKTLQKYYSTPDKVEALLTLGNISSLGDTPDECEAYHRDGGEELKNITTHILKKIINGLLKKEA